jgi:tyrosyl-DNA phosphodiesterase 2
MVWRCFRCTFDNEDSRTHCDMCEGARDTGQSQDEWACAQCTLLNPAANTCCGICGAPGFSRRATPNVDNALPTSALSPKSSVPAAPLVNQALPLTSKSAETAVPQKRKHEDDDHGKIPRSPGHTGPASISSPLPKQDSRLGFSLLTYNVWFDQTHLTRRIMAVGDIIQKHSPDVVMLQEVTKDIDDVLDSLPWMKNYFCRNVRFAEHYYTLIFTRIASDSATLVPLPQSIMLRDLKCVNLTLAGVPIVAGTVHLEVSQF